MWGNLALARKKALNFECKFLEAKRFIKVLIGTVERGGHLVKTRAYSREHNHARVLQIIVLPDGFADFPAVLFGHHYVQYNDIGMVISDQLQRLDSIGSRNDITVEALQALEQYPHQLGVVVSD